MKLIRALLLPLACIAAFNASAQWQWIDKEGHRVFSDRPPPIEVPERDILKRPSQHGGSYAPAAPASAPMPPAAAGGVDPALLEKKKKAEAALAAKNQEIEERNARIRADNCTRARQSMSGLDSGVRMTRTNERGEREFLDDAARATEAARLQGIINENCR